jgi:hypothetical protein
MDPVTIASILGLSYGIGSLGKGLLEGHWERGTKRAELKQLAKREESKRVALARLLREAKTSERRSIERLTSEKAKERRASREDELLKFFMEGQQNKLALAIQAMQGLNQPSVSRALPSGGFLNGARGRF